MKLINTSLILATAALLGAHNTQAAFLNFDGVPSGTAVNSIAPAGWDFEFGVFAPSVDSFGDDILGSEHWQIDTTAPAVTVDNPFARGYGSAPSPQNALNGVDQSILLLFSSPFNVGFFETTLDNSSFGNLGGQFIEFYNGLDELLYSLPIDETVPGFVARFDGDLQGVEKIVFPNNAFFDDLSVSVPETGNAVGSACFVAAIAAALRARRRSGQ